jgi:hypothetical protein
MHKVMQSYAHPEVQNDGKLAWQNSNRVVGSMARLYPHQTVKEREPQVTNRWPISSDPDRFKSLSQIVS